MKIITVMSDEHSYQMMQFVDHSILKTPNLDRLAAESVVFDSCYTPCPVCAPARAGFISGRYINRLGTWDNSTPYDGRVPGLSHYLADHQKSYVCIGKTHFHHEGDYGFTHQEFAGYMRRPDIGCFFRDRKTGRVGAEKRFEKIGLKTEESYDDRVLAASLNWLDAHSREDDWNLYIGFLDPHFPFYVKEENWNHFAGLITQVPRALKPPFTSLNRHLDWLRAYFKCEDVPEETVLKLLIGYHCAIAELDERIGVLLDKVDRLGLAKDTVFCYTSDHGEQLGYHGLWWKCTMFEQSAHVPMIVRVPGVSPTRVSAPVNLVDWFPTVCDYMGLPIPQGLDGESLRPFIATGKAGGHKDFSFSEYHAHGVPAGMFMIRWKQYKYVYYCFGRPQLFNLETDPGEDHNLLEPGTGPWEGLPMDGGDAGREGEPMDDGNVGGEGESAAGGDVGREGEPMDGGNVGGVGQSMDGGENFAPGPEYCHAMEIAQECHRRLLSVCNPYAVDRRAREFQGRTKEALGITEYSTDMGSCPVPHPEAVI